jgi:hypothetical protein
MNRSGSEVQILQMFAYSTRPLRVLRLRVFVGIKKISEMTAQLIVIDIVIPFRGRTLNKRLITKGVRHTFSMAHNA